MGQLPEFSKCEPKKCLRSLGRKCQSTDDLLQALLQFFWRLFLLLKCVSPLSWEISLSWRLRTRLRFFRTASTIWFIGIFSLMVLAVCFIFLRSVLIILAFISTLDQRYYSINQNTEQKLSRHLNSQVDWFQDKGEKFWKHYTLK